MNETIYDDGKLIVTPTEIRAKGFVLYTDNVSSISMNTIRPGRGMALSLGFSLLMIGAVGLLVYRMFGSLIGHQSPSVFILPLLGFLPLAGLAVLAWLVRITRLFLQTTGGPVVLASKISFSDPYETEMRHKEIKEAIKKAIAFRRKR
jgi:hypothetical protein